MKTAANHKLVTFILACMAAASAISGCAVHDTSQKAPLVYHSKMSDHNIKWMNHLNETFSLFWGYRFAGASEKTFKMEAPHIQELIVSERYHSFISNFKYNQLHQIEVMRLDWETDKLILISINIRFVNQQGVMNTVSMIDQWVNVRSNWYHLMQDYIYFPEIM